MSFKHCKCNSVPPLAMILTLFMSADIFGVVSAFWCVNAIDTFNWCHKKQVSSLFRSYCSIGETGASWVQGQVGTVDLISEISSREHHQLHEGFLLHQLIFHSCLYFTEKECCYYE